MSAKKKASRKGQRVSMATKMADRRARLASNRADRKRLDFLARWLAGGRWRQVIVADRPKRFSLRDGSDNSYMDSGDLRAAIDVLMAKSRGKFPR